MKSLFVNLEGLVLDKVEEAEAFDMIEKREPEETLLVEAINTDLKELYLAVLAWRKIEAKHLADWKLYQKEQDKVLGKRAWTAVETLKGIFWLFVCERYNLWDKPTLGLRNDWSIVESKPRPDVSDIIGKMFGNMGG